MSYAATSHRGADRVWLERQCKYSLNVLKQSCDVGNKDGCRTVGIKQVKKARTQVTWHKETQLQVSPGAKKEEPAAAKSLQSASPASTVRLGFS